MITQAEQLQTLIEDVARAEKAGLVTMIKHHDKQDNFSCFGEFLIADATATDDVFNELMGYLKHTYPDICSVLIHQHIYYGLL